MIRFCENIYLLSRDFKRLCNWLGIDHVFKYCYNLIGLSHHVLQTVYLDWLNGVLRKIQDNHSINPALVPDGAVKQDSAQELKAPLKFPILFPY